MVFSSPPLYLDPPSWHQQSNNIQHQGNGSCNEIPHHHPFPPLPPPAGGGGGDGVTVGPIRSGSRLAKISQPEVALKCPRCDSTNTKFCYFNNYNLSQPRHFCKTCRRYWTKGGALRNVPVGGGCRRNKKNKSSSNNSKTMSKVEMSQNGNNSNSNSNSISTSSMIINGGSLELNNHYSQLSFMDSNHNLANQFGLRFNGFQGGSNNLYDQLGFHVAGSHPVLSINNTHHDILSAGSDGGGCGGGGGRELHRFPLFEPLTGLFSFQCNKSNMDQHHHHHQQQQQQLRPQQKACDETSFSVEESEKTTATIQLMGPPSTIPRSARFSGASISSEMNNDNSYLGDGCNWVNNLSGLDSSSVNHII